MFAARALALFLASLPLVAQGGNSTRKIRPEISATAARCGSQIPWRKDLETALADAKKEQKLVFWYVPTVAGSPMDRKPEIDRYMRAGPFVSPEFVAFVNQHFVPLDVVPAGKVQKELGLVREKFIEPGFVVLDAEGMAKARIDKLSTLHSGWLLDWLVLAGGFEARKRAPKNVLFQMLGEPGCGAASGMSEEKLREALLALGPDDAAAAFTLGALLGRTGRSDRAKAVWAKGARQDPESPWGWKCAMEAEGVGPFWRGFETFLYPDPPALDGEGTRSKAPWPEDGVRRECVAYLLAMQRQHGGYDDSIYDFGGTDSLPNVYTACTSIVGLALLEEYPKPGPARVEQAIDRIRAYIADDAHLNLEDRDELVWAHVYRTRFLARLIDLREKDREAARPLLQKCVDHALAMQQKNGAWFHEYPNPFVIASTLVALKEAEMRGAKVEKQNLDRGIAALLACRAARTGAFTYGFQKAKDTMPVISAAGRMPLCEHALFVHGASSKDSLVQALAAAFEHHDQLESVRKYDDHANRHAYGGFFFWYDMHARCEAILALEKGEQRSELIEKQRKQILSIVEIDGCFVDSHELGKSYGTAMGLLCLALLRHGVGA